MSSTGVESMHDEAGWDGKEWHGMGRDGTRRDGTGRGKTLEMLIGTADRKSYLT